MAATGQHVMRWRTTSLFCCFRQHTQSKKRFVSLPQQFRALPHLVCWTRSGHGGVPGAMPDHHISLTSSRGCAQPYARFRHSNRRGAWHLRRLRCLDWLELCHVWAQATFQGVLSAHFVLLMTGCCGKTVPICTTDQVPSAFVSAKVPQQPLDPSTMMKNACGYESKH
jgi:hypothetical protein